MLKKEYRLFFLSLSYPFERGFLSLSEKEVSLKRLVLFLSMYRKKTVIVQGGGYSLDG